MEKGIESFLILNEKIAQVKVVNIKRAGISL